METPFCLQKARKICILKYGLIVRMLRFLENGYNIKIIKVDSMTVGVDKKEDIKKVEAVMRKNQITAETV